MTSSEHLAQAEAAYKDALERAIDRYSEPAKSHLSAEQKCARVEAEVEPLKRHIDKIKQLIA